jgi:hypothetical protein
MPRPKGITASAWSLPLPPTGEWGEASSGRAWISRGSPAWWTSFSKREITRQGSSYEQVSQELSILTAVETTFGEFAEGSGLNATIDAFFDALRGWRPIRWSACGATT